jgi:hypothetical protein
VDEELEAVSSYTDQHFNEQPSLEQLEQFYKESKEALDAAHKELADAERRERKRESDNWEGPGHVRARKERRYREADVSAAHAQLLDDEWCLNAAKVAPGNELVRENVQCSMATYDKGVESEAMGVIYDPVPQTGAPTDIMPVVSGYARGMVMNRGLLGVVGSIVALALVGGSIAILQAEHHCLELPPCCATPSVEAADAAQACEGYLGKMHGTVCWGVCSRQWVMWTVMGGMFGSMAALILILVRSNDTFRSDSIVGKIFDSACGEGEFCQPQMVHISGRPVSL